MVDGGQVSQVCVMFLSVRHWWDWLLECLGRCQSTNECLIRARKLGSDSEADYDRSLGDARLINARICLCDRMAYEFERARRNCKKPRLVRPKSAIVFG